MEKTCTRCGTTKPLEEFSKSKQTKSGYGAWCKMCQNAARRESAERVRAADPEAYEARRREYVRAYRKRHPDRVKEQDRRQSLKTKFGITIEQYDSMLDEQGGTCVCGASPGQRRLAVDHDRNCCSGDRSCGRCVRGLLCGNCNTALGLLKENRETIKCLLDYMEKYNNGDSGAQRVRT